MLFSVGILKSTEQKSRIRIQRRMPIQWEGSGIRIRCKTSRIRDTANNTQVKKNCKILLPVQQRSVSKDNKLAEGKPDQSLEYSSCHKKRPPCCASVKISFGSGIPELRIGIQEAN
jgi:hypothetical protein